MYTPTPVPGWLMGTGGAGDEGEEGGGCTHRANSTVKFLKMKVALEPQPTAGMLGLWAADSGQLTA